MKFNEDSRVKIPAIIHLTRLGYDYISLKNNTWTLTMPNSTLIDSCTAESNNVLTLLDLDDGSYEKLQVVEYDFDRSTKLCFIYCSIIQDSYIDSHQSRLLEIVPISTNANYTFFEPLHLKFRRIAIEAFSSIIHLSCAIQRVF